MALTVLDVNVLSNIIVIFSCLFLFYKWRIKNHRFALNFVIIAFVFLGVLLIEFLDASENSFFLLVAILSIIFTASLAYACTCLLKECRHILVVFALYALVPVFLAFENTPVNILFFIRVIGYVILIPFFMMLFTVRRKEIRIFSLLGVSAVSMGMLFLGTVITNPHLRELIPWYIIRIIFAAMFLILAHFSIHMHDGVLNHRRGKRK